MGTFSCGQDGSLDLEYYKALCVARKRELVQISLRMGDMRVCTLNFVSLRMFDQKLNDFHLKGSRYSCTEEYLTYQV